MSRLYIVLAALAAIIAVSVLADSDTSSAGNDWSDGLEYDIREGILYIEPVQDGESHTYTMRNFEPGTQPWNEEEGAFINVIIRANNIGSYAFYGLSNVAVVTMEYQDGIGVKVIGSYQFAGTGLISFSTQQVEAIGAYALANCRSLQEVWIEEQFRCNPAVLPTLFAGDPAIIHYHVSDANPYFSGDGTYDQGSRQVLSKDGDILYRYATGNTDGEWRGYSYEVPGTVQDVYINAFESSTYLMVVRLNNTTVIWDKAFSNCKNLLTVNITEKVTTIGTSVFADSQSLEEILVDPANRYFANGLDTYSGTLFSIDQDGNQVKLVCCPPKTYLDDGSFVVPSTVTEICTDAFSNCKNVSTVVLPNGLKTIGQNAFEYSNIESIDIPETVEYIGDHVFLMCEQLRFATIRGADYIGAGIFVHCTGLTRIFDYSGNYTDLLSTPVHVIYQLEKGAEIKDRGFVSGHTLVLPIVTEPEGVFALWADGTILRLNGESTTLTSTKLIKQYWQNGLNVTFDSAGGSSVDPQVIPYGRAPEKPANPVKDGYVFVYWKAPDGKEYDFQKPLMEDTTLTAEWTHKSANGNTSWFMVAIFIIIGLLVAIAVIRYMSSSCNT